MPKKLRARNCSGEAHLHYFTRATEAFNIRAILHITESDATTVTRIWHFVVVAEALLGSSTPDIERMRVNFAEVEFIYSIQYRSHLHK